MTTAARIRVDLPGRAYEILIGDGELDRLGERLASRLPARRATIVTDSIVGPLYLSRVAAGLKKSGFDVAAVTVPAGEATKSLDHLSRLYDALADKRHSREEPVIALGGGVVGDLAGLAAATWNRGVPFVQCPTTLEAQIDASIGGKTAINHPAGKNLIGAFHQPALVCIDVGCLKSLSPRDVTAGLAESIKHAVIADADFLAWHESSSPKIRSRDATAIVELVRRNCEIKARAVEADEREAATSGVGRAALNFGHTIGHAIEAQADYTLRHGEAVALGMIAEMELAVRAGRFAAPERDRVTALIAALGLPARTPQPLSIDEVISRLETDKKVRSGIVRFVVPTAIGRVNWLEDVSAADLRNAIESVSLP